MTSFRTGAACACLAALLWLPAQSRADDAPQTYALVVGSNAGGPGQPPLRFAERDARRFAGVLTELGRADPERVEVLLSPTRAQLDGSLQGLRARLQAHRSRDEPTRVIFYFSGHARADAANLSDARLPLGQLRDALGSLPATLTLVILDACQSGSFSGIKGAAPAADFSLNSVERLAAEGMAVLASSTGSELSQESERLGAGYFTHHLMVAMRGAGDADVDGRVSLDEAYRYAYERTLADTARTRVGGQHVTLEMNVKGQGQLPLTYPGEASATLALERELTGTVLVQQLGRGAVMAEVVKGPSAPLLLALPPGRYDVVVRDRGSVYECRAQLDAGGSSSVDLAACDKLSLAEWRAKGRPPTPPHELWFVEAGAGLSTLTDTPYTRRLSEFGYEELPQLFERTVARASVGVMVDRHVGFTASYQLLERRGYARDLVGPSGSHRDSFFWSSHYVGIGIRGAMPWRSRWLVTYVDAGVGVALSPTQLSLSEGANEMLDDELQLGPAIDLALGVQSNVGRRFGLFVELGYGWAAAPINRFGDRNNAGQARLLTGVRFRGEGNWR